MAGRNQLPVVFFIHSQSCPVLRTPRSMKMAKGRTVYIVEVSRPDSRDVFLIAEITSLNQYIFIP